jgi:hypothetical protein
MNEYITFNKVLWLMEQFQVQSPILNTFAYGNLVDFGQLHISGGTVEYPFIFCIPQSITYSDNTTNYQFTFIFADLLNYDLSNEKDCVSDMSLEARRFLSYLKRGIHTFPELYDNLDIDLPVSAIPFFERFGDHVAGVAMDCNLIVFEDLNACDYYPTPTPTTTTMPTPTITPTMTQTPTITPTITLTPSSTCSVSTQYLEVELQDNTKFKLILWNNNNFTSPATAFCDYGVSGTAYGSLGTVYTGQEAINNGQHQHQFDLATVLLPGETVTGFTVHNVNTLGCVCPVNVYYCGNYVVTQTIVSSGVISYEDCSGNAQSFSILPGAGTVICARLNTITTSTPSETTITYSTPCS